MANIKKLETLVKNFETVSKDTLKATIDNRQIDVDSLTDREKFAVMIFAELKRAFETKDYSLVLDCNYAQSKFHNKTDKQLEKGQANIWLVDYFRLISKANKNQSLIQVYVFTDPKKGTCRFTLCTSAAKVNREQFEALKDDLKFTVVIDKNGKAKTSERSNVGYDEIVTTVKSVCAVLATTVKPKEAVAEVEAVAESVAEKVGS